MTIETPPEIRRLLKKATSDWQSLADQPERIGQICATSRDRAWQKECLDWLDNFFELNPTDRDVGDLFFSGPSEMAFNKNEHYKIFFDAVRSTLRTALENDRLA